MLSWIKQFSESDNKLIVFGKQEIILGLPLYGIHNMQSINTIILIFKDYIYKSRCKGAEITFQGFKMALKVYYEIEKALATSKDKLEIHNKKWSMVKDLW